MRGFHQRTKPPLLLWRFSHTTKVSCSETKSYTKLTPFVRAVAKGTSFQLGAVNRNRWNLKQSVELEEHKQKIDKGPRGESQSNSRGVYGCGQSGCPSLGAGRLGRARSGNLGSLPTIAGLSQNTCHRGLLLKYHSTVPRTRSSRWSTVTVFSE